MLDQQLSVNLGIRFPQLPHLDPPILAALMVSNTTHESLWDITHRICDRYLGTQSRKDVQDFRPSCTDSDNAVNGWPQT